jgi:hypothetical protein
MAAADAGILVESTWISVMLISPHPPNFERELAEAISDIRRVNL